MKNENNKPPVYFIPNDNKAKKKTFMLIRTGAKSYAMSIMNLVSAKEAVTDYRKIDKKKD